MVIDIAETIAGECCKVYSVGRDQYVASFFLCVDDVAASKVIYEMMECSVEDVVLNLLCKIRVYPVEYFYTAEGAPTAVTKLFVVVQDQEGAQDGE